MNGKNRASKDRESPHGWKGGMRESACAPGRSVGEPHRGGSLRRRLRVKEEDASPMRAALPSYRVEPHENASVPCARRIFCFLEEL